ncbi:MULTISPECIES: Fic family protein [unclassified Acinetobacter]|uniref:Fic family protein n=1 Tax=unclassified Acinetobacter TaxID=196816 RepID=UPI0035B977FF
MNTIKQAYLDHIHTQDKAEFHRQLFAKIWQDTDDLPTLYAQLSDLKACFDSFRPLSANQVKHIAGVFDLEYTYESNRIEGNTLTLSETNLVINKGMMLNGKSMQEHLEAINHQEAIGYIKDMTSQSIVFDKRCLMDIHSLILHGIDRDNAGKYRLEDVYIYGSQSVLPSFLHVPNLMDSYFDFYQQNQNTMHPVELASEMHERLVSIHPFVDGNGRTARLVMNLLLLKAGYPITIIKSDDRLAYYDSLEKIQTGQDADKHDFKVFIAQNVKIWLLKYLDMIAVDMNPERQNMGEYFYQKIQPYLSTK